MTAVMTDGAVSKTTGTPRIRKKRWISRTTYYVSSSILALIFVFPLVWSALASVKTEQEANTAPLSFPSHIIGDNYQALMNYGDGLPLYLQNTLVVALLTVVGTVVLSFLAGYGFSLYSFRFKKLAFGAILFILMVPYPTILIPLYVLLAKVGLTNSLIGLAIIYITFQMPFAIFMMRNSFDAVPKELIEAARIDGCSTFKIMTTIMLPMVLPGLVTVAMFAFLAAWNEFFAPLIFLSDSTKYTLPVMVLNAQTGQYGTVNWGALQAGVTLMMLPCVLLFLLLQRLYVNGLISGAVKG